jgi:5-methyltetrahydrofolate--homocysteine methyltransferase
LIGGATTSVAHTAVKIVPNYTGAIVHVKDASRVIGVANQLLDADKSAEYKDLVQQEYASVRRRHADKKPRRELLSLEKARENKFIGNWSVYVPPKPKMVGVKIFEDYDINALVDSIDWTFFFRAWDMCGKYPEILTDKDMGEAARNLFEDGKELLKKIIDEKIVIEQAVIGFLT